MHISEEGPSTAAATDDFDGDSMGAYLEAMRGEDGHTRDAKGKARFNKTQGKRGRGDVEDDETSVTAGIQQLDVGGRRNKKVKKESVKVGAEFKAKVRSFSRGALRVVD